MTQPDACTSVPSGPSGPEPPSALLEPSAEAGVEAFTFGEPVPVMEQPWFLDYLECGTYGKWYEPPLNWDALTRSLRAMPHHPSALQAKLNILCGTFVPHALLPRALFRRLAQDFLIFGNAYLERIDNRLGQPLQLEVPLAKYVRRGKDLARYYFVPGWGRETRIGNPVFHLMQPDVSQEIYGLPEYLAALPSAWLNESATLFRRKYYQNGSHAGFILYLSDAATDDRDVQALRKALKDSKGPGNFRNLFFYAPNGKKDGIQILPISEVAAKDEFRNIKDVTRDDVLAAHRVPPQLLGIIPNNTGGFGDFEKAARVFAMNEIAPLQAVFLDLNIWLGDEVIRFKDYSLDPPAA